MPTINPLLIPTVAPGNLFDQLTTNTSINIRWLTALDPVFFEAINRPIADVAVRQLIIAKTLDAINLRLGHQALFPFLVPAKVDVGTTEIDLPGSWIWDLHASLPKKWENIRLAKIKRISGTNGVTSGFTGKLRLIFTGSEQGSATEVSLFQQDYEIDSVLDFQYLRIIAVSSTEEANAIPAGESETIAGFIIFRTLDTTEQETQTFLEGLAPPIAGTDADGDGEFDSPAVFEIVDTVDGGASVSDDFSLTALSHGTGLLVVSAFNSIPSLDSDVNTWLSAFNFPFRVTASRTSSGPIVVTIPSPLFQEFDLCVPCGDEPTGDSSGRFSPAWISKITRTSDTGEELQFTFATFNVNSNPDLASTTPVEFATLLLESDFVEGQIVKIEPIEDLLLADGSDQALFRQGFGRGHVRLSSLWAGTSTVVQDFFDAFGAVIDEPADVTFTKSSTILGAPGALSRSSRNTPTDGQSAALAGSSARRDPAQNPSDDNRFINEADQGIGQEVNFDDESGFTSNTDIEPIANKGALAHQIVFLTVDSSGTSHDYTTDILPRLRFLLGRDPEPGDFWYDGTRLKFFTPQNSWVG